MPNRFDKQYNTQYNHNMLNVNNVLHKLMIT